MALLTANTEGLTFFWPVGENDQHILVSISVASSLGKDTVSSLDKAHIVVVQFQLF